MTSVAYLAQDVVQESMKRIKEAFLNYDEVDDDPAQTGLKVIDKALKEIDLAYRRLVPIHDPLFDADGKRYGWLIGYQDCEHSAVRWIGLMIEAFDIPVPEIYGVPSA